MAKQKEKNGRATTISKHPKNSESETISQSLFKGLRFGWAGVNIELEPSLFIAAVKNWLRKLAPVTVTCSILIGLYMGSVFVLVEYVGMLCFSGHQSLEAGDWNTAESKYHEAIKFLDIPLFREMANFRSQLPGSKLLTLDSMKNRTAYAYTMQENLDEANRLYTQLLESEELLEADKNLNTAARTKIMIALWETRNNFAILMIKQARWNDAEKLLKRVLQDNPVDERLADVMDNLCIVYKNERKLRAARSCGEKALGMRRKLRNVLAIADSLDSIGAVYYEEGRLADAEAAFNSARSIYSQAFGPNHTHIMALKHELALVYKDMGKLNKSEAMLKQVIDYDKQNFGTNSLETAQAIENLGCLYRDENKTLPAESEFREAFEINNIVSAPDEGTLPVATSQQNLGTI